MLNKNHHKIQKQSIEINFRNFEDSISVQNKIVQLFNERIQPKINLLFDEIANDKYLLQIDKLKIDSGVLSNNNWENEWVETTLQKLTDELRTKHCKLITVEEEENKINETFFYFLKYGHLPWNKTITSQKELEEKINLSRALVSKLKSVLLSDENSIKRLLTGFAENFIKQILEAFASDKKELLDWMYVFFEETESMNQQSLQAFYKAALKAFSGKDETETIQYAFLNFIYTNADKPGKTKIEITIQKQLKIELDSLHKILTQKDLANQVSKGKKLVSEIYIQNAGIILTHPFLPQLFETTGLTEKNEWKSPASQQMAVKVLQYLSSGHDEFEECFCPLNKILCGLQPTDPIDTVEEITESAKEACTVLLTDMIGYWEKLKNTGIEGLRQAFIQRNGKLSITDNGWLLQVEQNSIDVLMTYLPWGVGIVKLPWMKDILYTEW